MRRQLEGPAAASTPGMMRPCRSPLLPFHPQAQPHPQAAPTSSSGMVWPRKRMPSSGSNSEVSHSMAGMPRMPPMACK